MFLAGCVDQLDTCPFWAAQGYCVGYSINGMPVGEVACRVSCNTCSSTAPVPSPMPTPMPSPVPSPAPVVAPGNANGEMLEGPLKGEEGLAIPLSPSSGAHDHHSRVGELCQHIVNTWLYSQVTKRPPDT